MCVVSCRVLVVLTRIQQGKEKQKGPKGKLLSTDGIDISELDVPDKFKKGNVDLKSLRYISSHVALRSFSSSSLFVFQHISFLFFLIIMGLLKY